MRDRPSSAGNPRGAPFVNMRQASGRQLSHRLSERRGLRGWEHRRSTSVWAAAILSALLVGGLVVASARAATLATPSRSTTIALTADETRLVVVNREANTVSIMRVKDTANNDVSVKLAEIGVGREPRCVAVHPNDEAA